jgi:hypothetical protein
VVKDGIETQLAGSPKTVVGKLGLLQEAMSADELAITTITYTHADRGPLVRAFSKGMV